MRQVLNSSVFQKYFGQSVNQVGLLINLSWHNSVPQRLDYQLCIALESKFLHHDQDQCDQEGGDGDFGDDSGFIDVQMLMKFRCADHGGQC